MSAVELQSAALAHYQKGNFAEAAAAFDQAAAAYRSEGDRAMAAEMQSNLSVSLRALKERGMEEAALGVDAENISGALRLYEFCGFRVVKRMALYRKGMA